MKLKKESGLLIALTDISLKENKYLFSVLTYSESARLEIINLTNKFQNIKVKTESISNCGIDNVINNFNENLSIDDIIKLYNK